jgi:hypothetical protein
VIDTKSEPKKTLVTPSIWNNYCANGDTVAYLIDEKSMVYDTSPVTGLPGMNLRHAGLGV